MWDERQYREREASYGISQGIIGPFFSILFFSPIDNLHVIIMRKDRSCGELSMAR